MNTIGTAMLHVTRTAGIEPQAGAQPESLGLGLATWLARSFAWLTRLRRPRA